MALLPAAAGAAPTKMQQVRTATVAERATASSRRTDADHDGLTTATEQRRTKTNPRKFDTDGDGFGDGAEVAAGTNPRNPRSVPAGPPAPPPVVPSSAPSAPPAAEEPAPPTSSEPTAPAPPPDTTAPQTTIGSGPSGTTTSTSASFQFTSSESDSSFECRLDSGSWTSCSSPKAYNGVDVGAHTFAVKATDEAGNTDASAATRGWTVQSAPSEPPPADPTCTQTLASGANLSSAISAAAGGAVICLGNGSYSVNVSKANKASMVTVRAAAGASPRSATRC